MPGPEDHHTISGPERFTSLDKPGEPLMQTHRFALGEFVAFTEQRFPGLIWAAEWEIIDLLEPADGTPRYRIRGPDGVSNEVISETELGVRLADRREHPAA
jgi:hypothetical protein